MGMIASDLLIKIPSALEQAHKITVKTA